MPTVTVKGWRGISEEKERESNLWSVSEKCLGVSKRASTPNRHLLPHLALVILLIGWFCASFLRETWYSAHQSLYLRCVCTHILWISNTYNIQCDLVKASIRGDRPTTEQAMHQTHCGCVCLSERVFISASTQDIARSIDSVDEVHDIGQTELYIPTYYLYVHYWFGPDSPSFPAIQPCKPLLAHIYST